MRPKRGTATALQKAYQYLARRDHSTFEIRKKLSLKGYPPEEVEEAVQKLTAQGYLDDSSFARGYVRHCQSSRRLGPAAVRRELQARGITGEILEEAAGSYSREQEEKNLGKIISHRLAKGESREKIFSYLFRKGYGTACIREGFRRVMDGPA